MANAGDLVVNLGLNSKKFTSGINQAQSGLSKFGSMATSVLNPITAGFAAVAAGAASAGVAVYMFAGRIAELAAVADKATQTGLSGAFIQKLGYAADQSGVSVETLHKAIGKLTILSGQAQSGGKAAGGAFKALGLDAKSLGGMSPEQQFRKVAEAISKIPTAAGRASAAVSVFGKSGLETTNLFAGGMNDLNKLLTEAESLGIGISDEGLAKAAAADDSIQRMKASFGALLDQITVGVAPAFDLVANAIANWIPPLTKFMDKFNGMDGKVQFLSDLFSTSLNLAFEEIKVSWNMLLQDMTIAGAKAAFDIAKKFTLVGQAQAAIDFAKRAAGLAKNPLQNNGVAAARAQRDAVLARLNGAAPGPQIPAAAAADDGSKLKNLAAGLFDSASGLFDKASLAAQSKMTDLKIKGGFLGSVVGQMFGGGADKVKTPKDAASIKQEENRTAGAMQKGSAEAFSTIVQAMMQSSKDPNVKATEKQTKQLIDAWKHNVPGFALVEAFA